MVVSGVYNHKESAMVHGVIYSYTWFEDCYCIHSDWHTKQETMSLVTKVAENRSREGVCYWTATIANPWTTGKSHCAKCSFYWPWVHVIWVQTFAVSLQATFQMFKNFGAIEWIGLLKVCIDISHQVKAIEVAEICFEADAVITDTRSAQCCVCSQASTVFLLMIDDW